MFEKTYKHKRQEITVTVSQHIVAAYRANGEQITNSNVDYYYEERGYGCQSEQAVAARFFASIVKPLLRDEPLRDEFSVWLDEFAGLWEGKHCAEDMTQGKAKFANMLERLRQQDWIWVEVGPTSGEWRFAKGRFECLMDWRTMTSRVRARRVKAALAA